VGKLQTDAIDVSVDEEQNAVFRSQVRKYLIICALSYNPPYNPPYK
jgi:hypothetical protein